MPRKGLIVAALLVGAAALYFLVGTTGLQLDVTKVIRGPAVELVYATGVVEPVLSADVAPEMTGRLVELLADEGQEVALGQPLARFEDAEQRADVAELEARVRNSEINLRRAQELWNRRSGSRENFDQAQSQLQQDEARLAAARSLLAKRVLVSPLDGIVLRRDGDVGETLASGRRVFVIGQKAPLRVELEIDEEDIARVQIGQKVLISADAFPRQSFASSIATITPQGDSDSKSYRARALLSAETPLPVGMTVEANVVLAEHQNAFLVPAEAVVKRAGKDVVFVVEGRHARQTAVEVGIRGASFDEILSGVAEGQMLIRAPGDKLADGARINPAGD